MAEKYGYVDSLKEHRESNAKFDYFFLGATITILGFSINSYDPLKSFQFVWLAHEAWGCLVVSFLAGLYRQEKLTGFLYYQTHRLGFENKSEPLKLAKHGNINLEDENNEPWTEKEIAERLEILEKGVKLTKAGETRTSRRATFAYKIQKWLFAIGLVALAGFKILNS